MKFIIKIFGLIFLLLITLFLHIVIVNILPRPFNTINILFVVSIILIYGWSVRSTVWLTFFFYFVIELYNTTFFGVVLLSATVSILFTYWLYQMYFTNRSWYSVFFLTALSVVSFRFIYSIILLLLSLVELQPTLSWSSLISGYFWEIFFTSVIASLLSLILHKVNNRFGTQRVASL